MTILPPPIVYVGTNGHNVSPGGHPALAVVEHIMQGTLAACDAWFSNPSSQASANYGIGSDGIIHCYVDPFAAVPSWAWANGVLNKPDATVQALVAKGQAMYGPVSPNVFTVSIEHAGFSGDPMPAPLQASSVWLTSWLCQQLAIAPSRETILGHYQFDAVNRAGCPGWTEQFWTDYVGAVAAALAPAPAPQPPPADGPEKYLADARKAIQDAQGRLADALESLNF